MAILYSPIDQSEIEGQVQPFPRCAFLMIHDNDRVSKVEARIQQIAREETADAGFSAKSASEVRRTGDFLAKIINLIRGCGFGIAVFSDATPAKTLANIFFEVGYCLALGKPTLLFIAGDATPSDFVRSEWIAFDPHREEDFRRAVRAALAEIDQYGAFLNELAVAAEEAEELIPELAYERYRRAFLVAGRRSSLDGMKRVSSRVLQARSEAEIASLMRATRRKMSDEFGHFLRMAERFGQPSRRR